jgi:hypothetical protein
MNNFEKKLAQVPRLQASPALNERVERLFQQAELTPPRFWQRPVRLWQCVAACLLCIGLGAQLEQETEETPPMIRERTVYIMPMDYTTTVEFGNADGTWGTPPQPMPALQSNGEPTNVL